MKLTSEMILTAGPSISDREMAYTQDAALNGWNRHHSDYITRFQNKMAQFIGVPHTMATSSCTGAMHLALAALGVKAGDEVIVPEITWVATASAVCYVGAKPIFCDVDPQSWTATAETIERCITPRTKAIMPVHLYGHPCLMSPIMELAAKHNLHVVEDAAQSIGGEYRGKKTGSFGVFSAFSFQGAKAMVTGEGGMLLANNPELFTRAQILGDHGRDLHKALFNNEIGYKYKMSNLQASLGLAQLERVDEIVGRKRQIFAWYKERLGDISEIQLNAELPECKNIFWMSSLVLSPSLAMTREELMIELKKRMIDTRPMFYPLSSMPMFEQQNNPNAYHAGLRGINLPSGHERTEEEVDYICSHVREVLGKAVNSAKPKGWLAYRDEVCATIAEGKETENQERFTLPLMDNGKQVGQMIPFNPSHAGDDKIIALLAKWREQSQDAFPGQFNVTLEGTKGWTKRQLLDLPDRFLFLIADDKGNMIGHNGLFRFDYKKRFCEVDNVVRGETSGKGLMTLALKALMQWARDDLHVQDFYLRVMSNNAHALNYYELAGFKEILRVPLVRLDNADGSMSWVSAGHHSYEAASRYFITMKFS
jgi:perosamine synthetase